MADGENLTKEWALYVYFTVDVPEAPLHESAVRNLIGMATLGSSSEVWVAAQIDLPGMLTRRYVLPEQSAQSGSSIVPPTMSIPNVNSADPRSIQDFIQWAAGECPARNTMIVLWGHGYGLDDYVPPGAHLHAPGQGVNALKMIVPSDRTRAFRPTLQQSPDRASLRTHPTQATPGPEHGYGDQSALDHWYGAIFDAHSKQVTPNMQVANAILSAAASLPGKKAAIVGWASCEMAMVEVWSELAACADFGIASQTPVPYQDWPLDRILRRLLLHAKSEPRVVSQMVTDAFLESYANEKSDYVAISAVDLSQMKTLQQAVKPLAEALKDAVSGPENLAGIFEARNYCPIFDPDGFIDLGCFCEFLTITLPGSLVGKACDPVLAALRSFVVTSGYSPRDPTRKLSQSTGLSIWFPSWIQNPSVRVIEKHRSMQYLEDGYPSTAFALATEWDKFLVAIRDAARSACQQKYSDSIVRSNYRK